MNQYRLLERLYPEEATDYQLAYEIVERGYTLHYGQLPGVSAMTDFTEDDAREVRHVLEMFETIQDALEVHGDPALQTNTRLTFQGFSGNDETSQLVYTEFLRKNGQWQHVGREGRPYSPGPQLPRYRRMLSAWQEMDSDQPLSAGQLRQLVQAAQ